MPIFDTPFKFSGEITYLAKISCIFDDQKAFFSSHFVWSNFEVFSDFSGLGPILGPDMDPEPPKMGSYHSTKLREHPRSWI